MYNPYEILGVSALDSKDVIKSKYRQLCKKYHPDLGGDVELFREVVRAWEFIDSHTTDNKEIWVHKTLFTVERKKI